MDMKHDIDNNNVRILRHMKLDSNATRGSLFKKLLWILYRKEARTKKRKRLSSARMCLEAFKMVENKNENKNENERVEAERFAQVVSEISSSFLIERSNRRKVRETTSVNQFRIGQKMDKSSEGIAEKHDRRRLRKRETQK